MMSVHSQESKCEGNRISSIADELQDQHVQFVMIPSCLLLKPHTCRGFCTLVLSFGTCLLFVVSWEVLVYPKGIYS